MGTPRWRDLEETSQAIIIGAATLTAATLGCLGAWLIWDGGLWAAAVAVGAWALLYVATAAAIVGDDLEDIRRREKRSMRAAGPGTGTSRPSPTGTIEPRDESDPFCTCPSCGLAGTHGVEVITWQNGRVEGAFLVMTIGDPPDGARRARRVCVFCEHVWHTAATKENR